MIYSSVHVHISLKQNIKICVKTAFVQLTSIVNIMLKWVLSIRCQDWELFKEARSIFFSVHLESVSNGWYLLIADIKDNYLFTNVTKTWWTSHDHTNRWFYFFSLCLYSRNPHTYTQNLNCHRFRKLYTKNTLTQN